MMFYDVAIRNARVIDPQRDLDHVEDVFIRNSLIVHPPQDNDYKVGEEVDAKGCIVTPGLIDFHGHLAYRAAGSGVNADIIFLPNGITAAVDCGSAGSANFENMVHNIITTSTITIRAYMLISPTGVLKDSESYDPKVIDIKKMEYLFERYPEYILGLKSRVGKSITGGKGYDQLKATIELSERFGCPAYVHIIDPEDSLEVAMPYFRGGDVFAHYLQGAGPHTILDEKGEIRESVWEARKRGVLFDIASAGGRGRSLAIAQKTIDEGFYPDIISADMILDSAYKKSTFSLLRLMTECLGMGLPLMEVIRACTQTPAKLMGMENFIGTLAPGALADVAIFKLPERPFQLNDNTGYTIDCNQLFVPQMTIKAGRIMYRQIEFTYY